MIYTKCISETGPTAKGILRCYLPFTTGEISERRVYPAILIIPGGGYQFVSQKGSRTGGAAVKTVFFLSQAAAKQFVKQGGIRVPPYTASKSGVKVITMLLANEWAKYNINVNAIAPGYMAADNTAALRADEKRLAEILDRIPACRWGLPGDLAGPVMFLASKAPGYVNGYTLAVDGGWLAR